MHSVKRSGFFGKFVIPRLLKMRFYRYFLSYFPRNCVTSDKPLSVVIPLAVKDIYKAGIAVSSIRKHVKHPINEIVIVGQDHDDIRDFCAANNLIYINENDVLPRAAFESNPNNHKKIKPSNWVYQQIIKLSVFDFINADAILVHDSDTYLMRDITFFCGDRQILFLADEYTKKYEKLLLYFLGPIKRHRRSFVTHSMLLQRKFLASLNNKVRENCGLSLVDAILHKIEAANSGALSEFEIYGNFITSFHQDAVKTRYWYNKKISPNTKIPLERLESRFWNMNTISAHEH